MRKVLAILTCKFLKLIGSKIGRGSSLPGKVALKIYPDILSKIIFPKYIIAVTGSNGKTSTVEMIAKVLSDSGKTFSYNKEGSNQIEGITSFILNDCTLSGFFRNDVILIETDERFAKYTFKYFTPTHYVIMNLYRDQLTRNGHPRFVFNCILESISSDTNLILNANDPLVSLFANDCKQACFFSVERHSQAENIFSGKYQDYKYCPKCFSRLDYEYYHYSEIGKFECQNCGYKSEDAKYKITKIDFDEGAIEVNNTYKVHMNFCNIFTVFNMLAAFSVCSEMGIDQPIIANSLSEYRSHSGRVIEFRIGNNDGVLLTSKHENSVSYDRSIDIVINQKQKVTVVIIVDAISRKYFTGEVSWLWDINFEALKASNVDKILLSGKYCYDLYNRFQYCDIDKSKLEVFCDIKNCVDFLKKNASTKIYVITCFSDKNKFLAEIKE